VLGTAYYMSPEAARGQPVGPASDVYSLGVVGYECLAGARPFNAVNPVAVATAHLHDVPPPLPSHVPREVSRLVLSCMAKDPADRLFPAAEVASRALSLKAALAPTVAVPVSGGATAPAHGAPTMVAPVLDDRPGWRADAPGQRRTRTVMAAAAALVVLVGFLLIKSCAGPDTGAATPRPTPTPAPVTVSAAAFVGRPAAEVVRSLTALGLQPTTRTVTTTDSRIATGTVIAVTPTGSLRRGTAVTVTVATRAPAPPPPRKHGKGKGGND
jgi:serine/threonine-protein kinase